ncbi:hypothetical protein B0O80DRAFT_452103 [Mortierella sp. GBAus27b]|nr:hypothetical protein B0O80DRAFT_452103 [Mortierella sp. GBAus27b]
MEDLPSSYCFFQSRNHAYFPTTPLPPKREIVRVHVEYMLHCKLTFFAWSTPMSFISLSRSRSWLWGQTNRTMSSHCTSRRIPRMHINLHFLSFPHLSLSLTHSAPPFLPSGAIEPLNVVVGVRFCKQLGNAIELYHPSPNHALPAGPFPAIATRQSGGNLFRHLIPPTLSLTPPPLFALFTPPIPYLMPSTFYKQHAYQWKGDMPMHAWHIHVVRVGERLALSTFLTRGGTTTRPLAW